MKRLGLTFDHIIGLRFAVNVAIGSTIIWFTLAYINSSSAIWALASMVAASDPQPVEARRLFKARLYNVLVGCGVGLFFLAIGGLKQWQLPIALAVTVLISTFVVRIKTMWRQAPITAAIVIAAGIVSGSAGSGMMRGFAKVAQVIFGCLVGLLVSWAMSKLWLIQPEPEPADTNSKP